MSIEPILSAISDGFAENRNLGIWVLDVYMYLQTRSRMKQLTVGIKRLRHLPVAIILSLCPDSFGRFCIPCSGEFFHGVSY